MGIKTERNRQKPTAPQGVFKKKNNGSEAPTGLKIWICCVSQWCSRTVAVRFFGEVLRLRLPLSFCTSWTNFRFRSNFFFSSILVFFFFILTRTLGDVVAALRFAVLPFLKSAVSCVSVQMVSVFFYVERIYFFRSVTSLLPRNPAGERVFPFFFCFVSCQILTKMVLSNRDSAEVLRLRLPSSFCASWTNFRFHSN